MRRLAAVLILPSGGLLLHARNRKWPGTCPGIRPRLSSRLCPLRGRLETTAGTVTNITVILGDHRSRVDHPRNKRLRHENAHRGDGGHDAHVLRDERRRHHDGQQDVQDRQDSNRRLTPVPSRLADVGGWYNHVLIVSFPGSDAMSGIDSCTPAQSYSAPDTANATVTGSCTDKAGHTTTKTFTFKYDGTGPALTPAPVARIGRERLVQPRTDRRLPGHRRYVRDQRLHPAAELQRAQTRPTPPSPVPALTTRATQPRRCSR